jgi:protein-tyrosine-phosphatase
VTDAPIRVLFVSTSNASRSILAEGVLRHIGADRFEVASAGVQAAAVVEPMTLQVLDQAGYDHDWAIAEPIDAYVGQAFDYVITLCDDARAVCPLFPGADQSIHWGYRDPAGVSDDAERLAAYNRVFTDLALRVRQFVTIARRQVPPDAPVTASA